MSPSYAMLRARNKSDSICPQMNVVRTSTEKGRGGQGREARDRKGFEST